uniref:Acetolactate synthase large subunit n=2 Tax=Porphyra TaxID=2784 RepID=ILVB_PORUM|nr:acetohydroxyacid synthase large subunit [Porphyra purpurea]P69683.1 RecName: Full=Acetolactate synthase large subunit; Short=AHAS; AltName: Full=Acetohydroxy-acid synthase large subunit; Short=ALS [Porphyra purpurea]P69684.1 RecName: Full=Acetolactate synthase large subunit; Short=AHAS; AltName: Full=Acetohydroxy-acid synthase large subunit; Short=ALS [Porphyra umbilicalis]AAA03052.1 acetolactate synthase [Porphyra umbilicalis]AAC08216.1 acetohydroxyacid synthase large subunit [Porphyra purp
MLSKQIIGSEKTGRFALLDSIVRHGVIHIFGYPGGAILPIYDELYAWEELSLIKNILVRHEQGASHAADAYSRSTGKVGVCFATSGPGATNLVSGIATAHIDSVPILAITGQVGRPFIGTDAFQEVDIFGITLPIVKHSYVVRDPRDMSRIVAEAFYICKHGRPGPVLIDVPKDVGLEKFNYFSVEPGQVKIPGCRPLSNLKSRQILMAAKMIQQSSQPLLYIGGGAIISDAHSIIKELVDLYKIPVTTTLMGKGIFNEDSEFCLGMLGMHGTAYANFAVSECDLLIALGARFDDRVTGKLDEFACNAQVIHVDIDPAEVGKNRIPQVAIVGDVTEVVTSLLNLLKNNFKPYPEQIISWQERIHRWRQQYPLLVPKKSTSISPQEILVTTNQLAQDAYFTTDVGQHQMWSAQFLKVKSKHWISSAGLGTMGYGLPAAIGAQVAHPNELVICVSGDSSFQMNMQELGTIAQYKLPIKIVIINNRWQGMVRQWQQAFYGERYSHSRMTEGAPNFQKLAEAFGIKAFTVNNRQNMESSLKDAMKYPGPVLLDCQVTENENCYPMVAPGKSNAQMIGIAKPQRGTASNYVSRNI